MAPSDNKHAGDGVSKLNAANKSLCDVLLAIAVEYPEKAVQTYLELKKDMKLVVTKRLHTMSRLPTHTVAEGTEPFWKAVKETADQLEVSNTNSRARTMAMLKVITAESGQPASEAQLAAFEAKFKDKSSSIWREMEASYFQLVERELGAPLPNLIKLVCDMIFNRIVYKSRDPQNEPIDPLVGEFMDSVLYINNSLLIGKSVETINVADYKEANLTFDEDGWVQRIPNTKTIAKSDAWKESATELNKAYKGMVEKGQAGTQPFLDNIDEYLATLNLKRY